MDLSPEEAENRFSKNLDLKPFSRGNGALGLPGDFSSCSRFIKAAFGKENAVSESPEESMSQIFHILESVSMIKGCVRLPEDKLEKTVYSACADGEKGIYYYKIYGNSRISAVDMRKENPEGTELVLYPFRTEQDILFQN
jgi:choloylglycine hydrolase